jgi:hypothetical protein
MPAQAGIQGCGSKPRWVPAYAGTTGKELMNGITVWVGDYFWFFAD